MQSLLSASLQMILSLIFCDVISSSLFRSPTVAPLVARQPFLKIAYYYKIRKYIVSTRLAIVLWPIFKKGPIIVLSNPNRRYNKLQPNCFCVKISPL